VRTGADARLVLADRSVRAVVLIAFVLMLGNGIVLPILPLFARSFGVGYGAAGLLIAAYGIARIGCDLGAGVVVDRVGERVAGATGLASMTAFAVLTGLAPSFAAAVVFWGAVGVSSAVTQTASYAFLLRVVPVAQMARTMGIFYGSFNVGLAAGGFVGGFIADHFGLESPLYAAAGLYALAGALYLLFVPRLERVSSSEAPPSSSWRQGLIRVARTPGLTAAAVSQLAYLWIFAAVFGTLLALFGRDELGMSAAAIGVVFAVGLVVELVVLYPAGSIADRRGRKVVLVPALVGLAALTAIIGLAGEPLVLGLLVAGLAVASGFGGVAPSAMFSDIAPRAELGTAAGVFRLFGDVGFALGPLVAGAVAASAGLTEAFLVSAVPAVVALALVVRTRETLHAASRA
jgi:DHA1 family multidrug resistance protein-like MFS transporter